MPKVKDEYWVTLQNRRYPTYPGVLVAAHEEGLLGIEVTVLQYPTPENGDTAVCSATVTMKGDGERELVYTEVGDASPKNVSPGIAKHAIRMAATRAKGRALRDAIALGVALLEELGGDEDAPDSNGKGTAKPAQRARHDPADHAERQPNHPVCSEEGCSETLSPSLVALCQRRGATLEGRFLCAVHLEEYARAYKARQTEAGSA